MLTQPLVKASVRLPHVCGRTSSTGDLVDNTRQFSLGDTILWSHQKVSECCVGTEGDLDTQWGEDATLGVKVSFRSEVDRVEQQMNVCVAKVQ